MQQDTKIALLFCGFFVGLLVFSGFMNLRNAQQASSGFVTLREDGVQVITITAKGGYTPNVLSATAGVPTELHVVTDGTYDCSSSVVIPDLRYKKLLPATGTEVIPLSAEQATGTLDGTCGMGMYAFEIAFR